MSNNNREMFVLRGTANWAKILGDPVPGYQGKGLFWTIDLSPDSVDEAINILGKDKIKDKSDERGKFVTLKNAYRSFTTKKGETRFTDPPKVVDARGRPWPQDVKVGNGTKVDVKFEVVDYGDKTGVYLKSVRILDHKEYESQEFAPLDENDEFWQENSSAEAPDFKDDFGLDDEVPV